MCGRSEPDCSWTGNSAISRCSISPSTANCGAAISSPSKSTMSLLMVTRVRERPYASARPAGGPLRDHRTNPADARRLSPCPAQITELLSLSRSLGAGTLTDDTPVRSSGFRMGRDDWARSIQLRYAFPSPDKGNVDLPEDRKSPRGPAAARTFEDREHGSISRGRSGRRARHR